MFSRAVKSVNTVAQRRLFSIFAGAESNQTVYVAGKLSREADGKKSNFDVVAEFQTVPSINVLTTNTFYGNTPTANAENVIEAYFLDAKAEAGKVKSVSIDEYLDNKSSVKLTGPAYKWTAAKVNESFLNGTKIDTDFTFNKDDVVVSSKATTKDGKVSKDSGSLKVVSRTDFEAAKKVIIEQMSINQTTLLAENLAKLNAKQTE